MPTYRVTWEIDIEATDPRAAAERALEIQRREESIATVFEVQWHGSTSKAWQLDLTEGDCVPFKRGPFKDRDTSVLMNLREDDPDVKPSLLPPFVPYDPSITKGGK